MQTGNIDRRESLFSKVGRRNRAGRIDAEQIIVGSFAVRFLFKEEVF